MLAANSSNKFFVYSNNQSIYIYLISGCKKCAQFKKRYFWWDTQGRFRNT